MNVSDKIISFFSPKAAFNRSRYRLASQVVSESSRKYDAAAFTRRTDGWMSAGTSPNQETIFVLRTIRNRSRELVRNNGYAKRAIQAIRNNTIGTGIRPTPTDSDRQDFDKIKDLWKQWAESKECDYEGRENFFGLQKLVIGAIAQDGEVIVRKRRVTGGIIPIKIQVCEADLLDETKENRQIPGGGYQMQGVEFDKKGNIRGYWLYNRHPSDSGEFISDFVKASDVLHIYLQERPGQVRGVPWMTSVMMKVKDFDDFEDAQLMQQKVAACFAAFITKESDDTATASDDNDDDNTERIEPGIIEHLHQGEEVSFANPPSTSGQETFGRMTLRGIAAGAGLSYETLSGDLSNVNFSSGRMGWLEMHRNISEWQERIMITQFCDPIWSWFIQGAKIAGKTKDDQIAASWTPPRREMIDPVKEVNGLTTLCQAGFDSYQNTLRTLGLDPEVVLKQMADDIKNFDANGIKVSSDYRQLLLKLQKNG